MENAGWSNTGRQKRQKRDALLKKQKSFAF
eukprot:COSAG02_NODE_14637_length_1252_cov_1.247181_3_plen_29_part_01